MKENKTLTMIVCLIILGLFIVSCAPTGPGTTPGTGGTTPSTGGQPADNATQELKKFKSTDDVQKFLASASSSSASGRGYSTESAKMSVSTGAADVMMETAAVPSGGGAGEYSQTNIQVQGVDEADFVKNDDKCIYTISGNKLVIVDAYPAKEAKIVSETKFDGNPRDLFVNKDRLVVFTQGYDRVYTIQKYDYMPRERYTQVTYALVYDISDRSDPKLVKNYSISGNYYQSRMIGDHVYIITNEYVYYYSGVVDVPVVKEAGKTIVSPEIYYFDNPEYNYNFNTVTSFDIFSDNIKSKSFMMGYSNTLYVSENNIYIAYQKNVPYNEYNSKERFYDIIVPLYPSDVQSKINDVKNDDSLKSYEKWEKVYPIIQDMYSGMSNDEKNTLTKKITDAVEEYQAKIEAERRKTVIHKIGINNGEIEYKDKGEVSGYLLNQFSLDEYNNNLRVATTTYVWGRGRSEMYNNVYVLDSNMDITGKLEDIAPDEKIYSTRFIGDRLYMVTFKRVDPLFVIDLSDASNPKILGELKIPGFSDYLHPYDENHIIGIGKETEGNQWGGVSLKGVKIALFDVSDVANPKQIDSYEIGQQGTESEALHEHKAFLFDKNKNLLVIPIYENEYRQYDEKLQYYRWKTWQGAYVLDISLDGIDLRGKVTHAEEDSDSQYYYYGSQSAVRRSLYMDDVLYTISAKKIKMNDLSNIDTELNEVRLPYEEYVYPIYRGGPVMVEEAVME